MSITIPSYEELFGDLDYSTGDEYRSVLSPAAYLVDIMNLKDWKWGDDNDAVDDRRGDIANILLDSENTITEIPFLDIANEVMENKVVSIRTEETGTAPLDAYSVLSAADVNYPFNLPFNLKHREFMRIMDYTNMKPHELYAAYKSAFTSDDVKIFAREYLGLSSEEMTVLFTPDTDSTVISTKWGMSSNDFSIFTDGDGTDSNGVEKFKSLAELSFPELRELLFQDLSDDEINSGVSKDFFINHETGTYENIFINLISGFAEDETYGDIKVHYLRLYKLNSGTGKYEAYKTGTTAVPVPASYFDRIHRFIRMSRKTGLSFTETDLVLRSMCGGVLDSNCLIPFAFVKYMKDKFELSVEEICAFFAPVKDYGDGRLAEKGNFFYRLFDRNYDKSVLDPELESTEFINRVKSALDLKDKELEDLKTRFSITFTTSKYNDLTVLYRASKIARILDISINDFSDLLEILGQNKDMNFRNFNMFMPVANLDPEPSDGITGLFAETSPDSAKIMKMIRILQCLESVSAWINDSEIYPEQLQFLCTDNTDETVDGILSDDEAEDFFLDLNEQFGQCLVKENTFQSSVIDAVVSTAITAKLKISSPAILTSNGIIRMKTANDNGTAITQISTILETVINSLDSVIENRTVSSNELTEIGIAEASHPDFLTKMTALGYSDISGYITDDGLDYFSDSGNRATFTLAGYETLKETIFDYYARLAGANAKFSELVLAQADSIAVKIDSMASKQSSTMYKVTANAYAMRTASVSKLIKKIFGSTDYTAAINFMEPVINVCKNHPDSVMANLSGTYKSYFKNLQRFALTVSIVKFKPDEIERAFTDIPQGVISLNNLKLLQIFRKLCGTFSSAGRKMLDYLSGSTFTDTELARITQWPENEITYLAGSTGIISDTNLSHVQCVSEIYEKVKISSKFSSTSQKIRESVWNNIYGGTVNFTNANSVLMEMLKSFAGSGERENLYAELHNRLNIDKRDSLIPYLVFKMEETEYGTIKSARDLYEYLLLDVEMGESATASRIQEAMMCMQLFYHRFRLNIETLVQPQPIPEEATEKEIAELELELTTRKNKLQAKIEDWWPWMKNYRVWEANRKVFLYPENYIRPELRDTRSDAFKELEEVLVQGEITDESVEEAYRTYLEKFADTSRLIIAGGYVYQLYNVKDDTTEKKIILFGRSRTQPKKFYYMTGDIYTAEKMVENEVIEVDQVSWSPWIDLGITINSDRVFPVYAFNRIFVFWFEIEEKNKSTSATAEIIRYEPVFYYSFLNLNNKWVAPQLMLSMADELNYMAQIHDPNMSLFTVDKNYPNAELYTLTDEDTTQTRLTTRQLLEHAVLDITNPQAYTSYNPEECIYISFEVGRGATGADEYSSDGDLVLYQYEGKFTNDLVFNECSIDQATKDRLEPDADFPMDRLGIYPDEYKHWKGFFKNTFSAPWFSFDEKGGSFLCKPAVIPDPPVIRNYTANDGGGDKRNDVSKDGEYTIIYAMANHSPSPIPLPDEAFSEREGTGFGKVHMLFNSTKKYRYAYHDETGYHFSDELDQSARWGKYNRFYRWKENVISAVTTVTDPKAIYLLTASHYIKSPFSGAETDGLSSTLAAATLLDGATLYTGPDDFKTYLGGCSRAFKFGVNIYIVNETTYKTFTISDFLTALHTALGEQTGFTAIDAICIQKHSILNEHTLLVSCGENLLVYDCSTGKGKVKLLADVFGPLQATEKVWKASETPSLSAMTTDSNGNLILFYNRAFVVLAQPENNMPEPVTNRWGNKPNILIKDGAVYKPIEAAFIDVSGNIFLFMTGSAKDLKYLCHSRMPDTDMNYFYADHTPYADKDEWTPFPELSGESDEIIELFSVNKSNTVDQDINITNLEAASGFELDGKCYLLVHITCETSLTRWKWRWVRVKKRNWWGKKKTKKYKVKVYYRQTYTQEKDAYIRFTITETDGVKNISIDEGYPQLLTGKWTNMPGDFNNWITSTFKYSEFDSTLNDDVDVLYIFREKNDDENFDTYVRYKKTRNFPHELEEVEYNLIRLTSNTSDLLNRELFMNGIEGILSLDTQMQQEIPLIRNFTDDTEVTDEDIETYYKPDTGNYETDIGTGKIIRSTVDPKYLDIPGTITYNTATYSYINNDNVLNEDYVEYFDYTSINGQYYWEIFYHAPFLIAQALNNAQNFDEARRWYEFIFDPTQADTEITELSEFWKFMPFQWDLNIGEEGSDTVLDRNLYHALTYRTQLETYMDDPFDPHAIAALRQIAYRKAIVMNYIDNLLDWGDMLFTQYTRESINEARMLYVLAYELLGSKPENVGEIKHSDVTNYRDMYDSSLGTASFMNQVLISLENGIYSTSSVSQSTVNDSISNPYFYIPENRDFIAYWDRVEDRLSKIRNTLNIDGIKQSLALFEPPLDPMALVRAIGSGAGLTQAVSEALLGNFNASIPHYRFSFVLAKAKELAQRLTGFGQSYLSALEKKDAEELAQLRNTQEKQILELTLAIKEAQLEETDETLNSLQASLKNAKTRLSHYETLISDGLSGYEKKHISLTEKATACSTASNVMGLVASATALTPQGGSLFAITYGGIQISGSNKGKSDALSELASFFGKQANLASILGGHKRREQDWKFQRNLANCDIEQFERQINGAKIRKAIARKEIEVTKKQIKNNESIDTFMTGKFSSKQLYLWMSSKLAGIYFQTYQLALDLAKGAEKSFQFELGLKEGDVNFISPYYWDSLKKGLLAGERLQVDLDRMEKGYMDKNHRRFEISKSVSLADLDPAALFELKENRSCEFTLTEQLFDYDFPGHYCRQIKSISISFPAVTGPYENINATLTQLTNRTLIEPNKDGVQILLDMSESQHDSIRMGWRSMQQIALSRGMNDAGLFQLNFQDERYLPFEGTGAVSRWRLEFNGYTGGFDISTLSDVIIKVDYTALQGGETFASTVKKKLGVAEAAEMFSMAGNFPEAWNAFMLDPESGISFALTRDMLAQMKGGDITGAMIAFDLTEDGKDILSEVSMDLTIDIGSADPVQLNNVTLLELEEEDYLNISSSATDCILEPLSEVESFTADNIRDIALVLVYNRKVMF